MNVEAPWTIDELQAAVAAALAGYEAPANGQIRGIPDKRTLRYYTTLGLMDRPAAMRGRTGLYDRRHLVQVVAIKRLQARGRSLRQIQAELAGRPPSELERLAELPEGLRAPPPSSGDSERRRGAFWAERPAAPAAPSGPSLSLGISLAGRAQLIIPKGRTPTAEDVAALRAAAAPLLEALEARGLISSEEEP